MENVEKRYKQQQVLKGIDITVENPQIIALVGPNGAGKTTLMDCMTNLLPINRGTIELLGKKHTDSSIFKEVSYLQDNRILYSDLTGYDHLKFIARIQQSPVTKVFEVAERIGMTGYMKKRVRNYSLGMKQHLLLAMSIINEPKLLLLDEPLNGLDPSSAIMMRNLLLDLHQEGATIVISSHNLDEIDRLTNQIYFMKNGTLVKESLQDFMTNQYIVTVDQPTAAQQHLLSAKRPFTMNDHQQICFTDDQLPLQTFISCMQEHKIIIEQIEQEKVGAEKRYRQLFEQEQRK